MIHRPSSEQWGTISCLTSRWTLWLGTTCWTTTLRTIEIGVVWMSSGMWLLCMAPWRRFIRLEINLLNCQSLRDLHCELIKRQAGKENVPRPNLEIWELSWSVASYIGLGDVFVMLYVYDIRIRVESRNHPICFFFLHFLIIILLCYSSDRFGFAGFRRRVSLVHHQGMWSHWKSVDGYNKWLGYGLSAISIT